MVHLVEGAFATQGGRVGLQLPPSKIEQLEPAIELVFTQIQGVG
jgi:hypothetical protein